jgi:GMP synthase-like glutamine amidotransferase
VRVVVLRHHDVDSGGLIAEAFEARGASIQVCTPPVEGQLPALDGIDHIVVLGAVSSVNDPDPWIAAELDWLREADRRGVPILGICFGGQALCVVAGGRVEQAPRKEFGWTTVSPVEADVVAAGPHSIPTGPHPIPAGPHPIPAGPWMEYHGDRCLVPASATVLARNELCVQAFSVGRHLGVQFHPEVDGAQLKLWLDNGADAEAIAQGFDPSELLAQTIKEEPAARARADRLVASALAIAEAGRAG